MEAAWVRTSHDHGLMAVAGAVCGTGGAAHEQARIHSAVPWRRNNVRPTPRTRGEPFSASWRNCS